ncbi:hypothetical protein J6590_028844 [Homalodisca vitripennis]|nr:hypothetical protein J6590_028844 [Homalodisca vitripennis]
MIRVGLSPGWCQKPGTTPLLPPSKTDIKAESSTPYISETLVDRTEAVKALNVEASEFEDFIDDDNVAICGELTYTDIIASVSEMFTLHSSDKDRSRAQSLLIQTLLLRKC